MSSMVNLNKTENAFICVTGNVFEPFIWKSTPKKSAAAVLSFDHITFLVVIQLLELRIQPRNRLGSAAFFGFVCLAIRRLPYIFIPTFSSPTFSSPAFQRPQRCIRCRITSLSHLRRSNRGSLQFYKLQPQKTSRNRKYTAAKTAKEKEPYWPLSKREPSATQPPPSADKIFVEPQGTATRTA